MIYLEIGPNEEGQRLDRFLRKYLASAPLSVIYKTIRKDVKINGKRKSENYLLNKGDEVVLYISDEDYKKYGARPSRQRSKRQFEIAYEDENILVVDKPFGLLTHGDAKEKKNHLSNQVLDYLIENGDYNPRVEKTFSPAPVNRLDRNTTGLVIFGKNAKSLRELNKLIRSEGQGERGIEKYYRTMVLGRLKQELDLWDVMVKDATTNTVRIVDDTSSEAKGMHTIVRPIRAGKVSLVEARILTGRTHQIRVQLAAAGYPLIGDPKYGNLAFNKTCKKDLGLNTQLLHACRIVFNVGSESDLAYLNGREVEADLPETFSEVAEKLGLL